MNPTFEKATEQATAFHKLWTETVTKTMLAAAAGASSPSPEMLRQIRAGIFQALAQAWDEFMRSPQFLESMKQWMDSAVSFRRITNDFMARIRSETRSPSRDDVDTLMLSVRHMEKRLLDRLDELAARLDTVNPPASAAGRGKRLRRQQRQTNTQGRRPKKRRAAAEN